MSKFSYELWSKDYDLIKPKSLALALIGDMLGGLLQMHDNSKSKCQCHRCSASLNYNYYDEFLVFVKQCEVDSESEKAERFVLEALADIKSKAAVIYESFGQLDYPRAATSEMLEMREFFSKIAEHYVDRCEHTTQEIEQGIVDTNNYGFVKFRQSTVIEVEGHQWQLDTDVLGDSGEIEIKIDGNEVAELDGHDVNCIGILFQIMTSAAIERSIERRAVDRFITHADNKDELVCKSKAMASVFGGSYKSYVAITSFTLAQKKEGAPLSKEDQLTGFFMHEHRSDISVVKEAVKIFADKPRYH